MGLRLMYDKNAIYFSVIIKKHLWVSDHFEYYIKMVSKATGKSSYPIRRYSVKIERFRNFNNFTIVSKIY